MKKGLFLFALTFLLSLKSESQTFLYCPGDTVYLGLTAYSGSLQWQQSIDSVNWTVISGATYSPYGIVFSSDRFYRALITNPNCTPIYSSIKKAELNNTGCYPSGSVFCNGATLVIEVTNPITGKTWMDRNLGALQVAQSSTDSLSYGDLYQWGRRSDGHQCRYSPTTSTLSSADQPSHGNFILSPSAPNDWRNPQNTNLWQGLNGVNNPCPLGYRLPTEIEVTNERATWNTNNSLGAMSSILKLPDAGRRLNNGLLSNVGGNGSCWTSNVNGANSRSFYYNTTGTGFTSYIRSAGQSVRCIKN